MAKMITPAIKDLTYPFKKLGNNCETILKKAVKAGGAVAADAVRESLVATGSKDTGALLDSLGMTDVDRDSNGTLNVKIGFDGYDEKGEPNQVKARVLESGRSGQPGRNKTGFMKKAVNRCKGPVVDKMEKVLDEEILKEFNSK